MTHRASGALPRSIDTKGPRDHNTGQFQNKKSEILIRVPKMTRKNVDRLWIFFKILSYITQKFKNLAEKKKKLCSLFLRKNIL